MSTDNESKTPGVVKALMAHQERLGDTDGVFARRYIGCSAPTWSLLKAGKYNVKDLSPMLVRCDAALSLLNDQSERASYDGNKGKIVDLTPIRAAITAVKSCYDVDQNRLVVFLAPSGGGKTTLSRKLREVYSGAAVVVEATETWRSSYFNALIAVAKAIGLTEKFNNPNKAEAAVLDHLSISQRILIVDEGHYCGPAALNLLKVILNRTKTRIVLCSIPELWNRLEKKAYEEVLQLRRRTHAKIVVPEISRADARQFLSTRLAGYAGLGDTERDAVALAVASANRFGLYDTLARICHEIEAEAGDQPVTLELVRAAINRVEALRS